MKRCAYGFAVAVMLVGLAPIPTVAVGTAPCGELRGTPLTNGLILSATAVEAGRFVPPDGVVLSPEVLKALPAFCRVTSKLTPSSDSAIHVEVWLPIDRWNQRLQAVGDGGLAGFIPYALMAPGLTDGYAVTGTDTGHEGDTAAFMPEHPERLTDFAYRATHEMAGAAKALVTAFYGVAPRFSYYNACSGGGRHAITSAQRYPDDFQGIIAGAASWDQA